MCGSDSRIGIEPAGNGYVVDSYVSRKDGHGIHKKDVALKPEHVLKIVAGHLAKAKGTKHAGSAGEAGLKKALVGKSNSSKPGSRKK